mmetsp:Transcript_39538/g.55088  ORF Transcript_39538/g.55088 Transcript_39538/m.55088 type:complete len:369 (-) Transcript_39538:58-1164(-)
MVLEKVLTSLIAVVAVFLVYFYNTGNAFFFHTVPEGHVGVYRRFGAILPGTSQPGLHFINPITTSVDFIQITLQTDTVINIPCGTSGGITIYFEKIEVVNRLDRGHVYKTVRDYGVNYDKVWIFDKIHHEINQFCSSHTLREVYIDLFSELDESLATALQGACDQYDTGIDIIAIRVTKPKIPNNILREFEQVEASKAHLSVLQQQQQAAVREAETVAMKEKIQAEKERQIANIQAEKLADVSLINERKKTSETEAEAERKKLVSRIKEEQLTLEKKGQAERTRIDNTLRAEKETMETEIYYERKVKELEVQKQQLTPEYLELKRIEGMSHAIASNTKIYFGDSIPSVMYSMFPSHSETVENLIVKDE